MRTFWILFVQGMDSGFGDDEAYNVYDKPWREENSVANNIYRPSKKLDNDLYSDDLDTLMKTKRYVWKHFTFQPIISVLLLCLIFLP